jgi:hypothetical protein
MPKRRTLQPEKSCGPAFFPFHWPHVRCNWVNRWDVHIRPTVEDSTLMPVPHTDGTLPRRTSLSSSLSQQCCRRVCTEATRRSKQTGFSCARDATPPRRALGVPMLKLLGRCRTILVDVWVRAFDRTSLALLAPSLVSNIPSYAFAIHFHAWRLRFQITVIRKTTRFQNPCFSHVFTPHQIP